MEWVGGQRQGSHGRLIIESSELHLQIAYHMHGKKKILLSLNVTESTPYLLKSGALHFTITACKIELYVSTHFSTT